jgi:hypothetical protein
VDVLPARLLLLHGGCSGEVTKMTCVSNTSDSVSTR